MCNLISILTLVLAGAPGSETMWLGTVVVEGMVHEPGGYHPHTTTISLRLRESNRVPIDGGFRVPLTSRSSTSDVKHSLHLTDGLLVCSGTGRETLTNDTFGYLETKAGRTVYHLAIPRAFGAFACGLNRSTRWGCPAFVDTSSFGKKESTMSGKKRRVFPKEFRLQMVELVRSGRTPEELSREFEPSAQAIRN